MSKPVNRILMVLPGDRVQGHLLISPLMTEQAATKRLNKVRPQVIVRQTG
jgi:hypothetical protein